MVSLQNCPARDGTSALPGSEGSDGSGQELKDLEPPHHVSSLHSFSQSGRTL